MAEAAPSIEERMDAYLSAEDAPAEQPAEQPAEPVAEQSAEAEAQPEEQAEETAEAVETEEVAEGSEEVEASADDEDVQTIEDIAELAEHLGVDVSEMYNLRIPLTDADGKKREVSLGEWKDGYLLNEEAHKVQKQAQEEYDSLMQQRVQFEQQVQEQAYQSSRYIEAAQQELTQEFNAINWERLRAESPEQYAVKRQDFIERNGRLGGLKQEIQNEFQQQQQKILEEKQALFGQHLQREQNMLFEAVPEWRNEEAAATEKSRVSEYLQSAGWSRPEIEGISDHRAIVIARKAMLFDESQKKSVKAKKALKVGKRVLKPAARQSKAEQKTDSTRGLKAQLRKSGKIEDAVALYEALGG